MNKDRIQKLIIIIFSALFIILPTIFMNRVQGKISVNENRYLANFPQIFDSNGKFNADFKSGFENWFDDNIGFRDKFVDLSVYIKFKILGQHSNEKVEEGKDGWYFYKLDNNLDIAYGKYEFGKDTLESIKKHQLKIKENLAKQGIDYVLILPPSKVSVYPENIESADCSIIKTPVDILADYLEKETDIKVIRLKQELIDAKTNKQVFFKTDTHWNETGAYVAYNKIIKDLNRFNIIKSKPVEVNFVEGEYRGEFSAMLGKSDILPIEKTLKTEIKQPKSVKITDGQLFTDLENIKENLGVYNPSYLYKNNSADNKKVLMFGDSMFGGWNMPALLSENFSEFTYIWSYDIEQSYIDLIKPDVVFYDMGERYLKILDTKSSNFTRNILNNPVAQIISTDMPTEIERGKSYDVNITVKNTSNQSWSETDMVRLCIWQDGQDFGYRVNIPDGVEIKPSEEYTFTLCGFVAPPSDSTYVEFQMLQEGITYFGDRYRVDVKVKE